MLRFTRLGNMYYFTETEYSLLSSTSLTNKERDYVINQILSVMLDTSSKRDLLVFFGLLAVYSGCLSYREIRAAVDSDKRPRDGYHILEHLDTYAQFIDRRGLSLFAGLVILRLWTLDEIRERADIKNEQTSESMASNAA